MASYHQEAITRTIVDNDLQASYGITRLEWVNSLAPGKYYCNFELVIFKAISMIDIWSISSEIALRWMPQHLADD